MAIDAFMLLNSMGLVFLVYALVNFWNEWRRVKSMNHRLFHLDERIVGNRIAVIPPVYLYPKNANSVIPFPARYRQINVSSEHHRGATVTIEMRERVVHELHANRGSTRKSQGA